MENCENIVIGLGITSSILFLGIIIGSCCFCKFMNGIRIF